MQTRYTPLAYNIISSCIQLMIRGTIIKSNMHDTIE